VTESLCVADRARAQVPKRSGKPKLSAVSLNLVIIYSININITNMDILIVEDNSKFAEILRTLLKKKLRYSTIHLSKSVNDAYRKLLQRRFDYIFCDITINRPMAGFFLLYRIKKKRLENILLMSTAFENHLFLKIFRSYLMNFFNISGICKKSEVLSGNLRFYKCDNITDF